VKCLQPTSKDFFKKAKTNPKKNKTQSKPQLEKSKKIAKPNPNLN
jgi:hypothetical protein